LRNRCAGPPKSDCSLTTQLLPAVAEPRSPPPKRTSERDSAPSWGAARADSPHQTLVLPLVRSPIHRVGPKCSVDEAKCATPPEMISSRFKDFCRGAWLLSGKCRRGRAFAYPCPELKRLWYRLAPLRPRLLQLSLILRRDDLRNYCAKSQAIQLAERLPQRQL
jgi:hypothetical protein